jgi:hypothetical protein
MWNYAYLSRLAKLNGGPEILVNKLIASGVKSGKTSMIPLVIAVAILSPIVVELSKKLKKYFSEKKRLSEEEISLVKRELIQGIKDYDQSKAEEQNDLTKSDATKTEE